MKEIIEVEPRLKEYVPYKGDFSLSGYYTEGGRIGDPLVNTWRGIMQRCYEPTARGYHKYGAKGISVCERWHNIATFLEDVKKIQGYGQEGVQLDKDYYGSNQYAPDTCVWLPSYLNAMYTSRVKPILVTAPDGNELVFLTQTEAGNVLGIGHKRISAWILGTRTPDSSLFFGWRFEFLATDKILRYPLESL